MPSVRCLALGDDCPSVCGGVVNDDSNVVVPCVPTSQPSSRSSSGSSSEIILHLQDLVSGQVPARVVPSRVSAVGCRAHSVSNDSVDVSRCNFDSASRGSAVSVRTDSFIRLGCCGAVARPKEERSSSLPGILSFRRTSKVGESDSSTGISLASVGTDRPVIISVALPVPSDDLVRPCVGPGVDGAVSVGIEHENSTVVGALSATIEGSCDDVGVPTRLVVDEGSGAVLVPYYSGSYWRGKRCVVCGPCDYVGTADSTVLCCFGDQSHRCRRSEP